MIYTFIEAQKTNHRISRMCRILKVSKSGFYDWRDRAPSTRAQADALLTQKIVRIHKDSRETYGAPRIHFELRMLGVRCARKRVARLMREAGMFGCGGRRRKEGSHHLTLTSRMHSPCARSSCEAQLYPRSSGSSVGCGHITYVRTWEGWLYLSFVLDTYSPGRSSWAGPWQTTSGRSLCWRR